MPKVLLLGATGLLGSEFKNFLIQSDFNVVCPNRNELDLFNQKELISFLKTNNSYNYVINCSGYNFVDKAEENKEEESLCFWYNSEVPKMIGGIFQDVNPSCKIIQFSSDYVFDGKKNEEYLESDLKNPLSVYGYSKSLGEEHMLKENMNGVVIRTSWLFGPAKLNFLNKIFNRTLAGETLNVVSDQIGKPTYTVDLAKCVVENLDILDNGIYHLSNETIFSWYDFAKFALGLMQNKFKINSVKTSELELLAIRPEFSALKNSKLPLLRPGAKAITDYVNKYIL